MNKLFAIIMFSAVLLNGCSLFKSSPDNNYSPNKSVISPGALAVPDMRIEQIRKELAENTVKIDDLGKEISSTSDALPQSKEASLIKQNSEKILYVNSDNGQKVLDLKEVKKQLETASKEIEVLKKENIDLKDSSMKEYKKTWLMISAFAALIFTVGVFIAVGYSPSIGISLIVASLATTMVSVFMISYAYIIGIIGGIACFAILGFFIYQSFSERKALKESVLTMEATKYKVWDNDVRSQIQGVQSQKTQSIVQNIKTQLKKDGVYLMNEINQKAQTPPEPANQTPNSPLSPAIQQAVTNAVKQAAQGATQPIVHVHPVIAPPATVTQPATSNSSSSSSSLTSY